MTDEVISQERAFGRMEGKIDLLLIELTRREKHRDDQHADHEHRLTSLERARWYVGGAVAALATYAAKLHFLPQ